MRQVLRIFIPLYSPSSSSEPAMACFLSLEMQSVERTPLISRTSCHSCMVEFMSTPGRNYVYSWSNLCIENYTCYCNFYPSSTNPGTLAALLEGSLSSQAVPEKFEYSSFKKKLKVSENVAITKKWVSQKIESHQQYLE